MRLISLDRVTHVCGQTWKFPVSHDFLCLKNHQLQCSCQDWYKITILYSSGEQPWHQWAPQTLPNSVCVNHRIHFKCIRNTQAYYSYTRDTKRLHEYSLKPRSFSRWDKVYSCISSLSSCFLYYGMTLTKQVLQVKLICMVFIFTFDLIRVRVTNFMLVLTFTPSFWLFSIINIGFVNVLIQLSWLTIH